MVKHSCNLRWRCRDKVYEEIPASLFQELYSDLQELAPKPDPGAKGPGRPQKVGQAEAALLVVVKEHYSMTYRDLASSPQAKRLGLDVHYTTIHKAIQRLPTSLLQQAVRMLAEKVSQDTMEAAVDATGFRPPEVQHPHCGDERDKG